MPRELLIPGPLTNVMEEPAVELPLLDGPGISQRAAAARSQVTWRWLVYRKEL